MVRTEEKLNIELLEDRVLVEPFPIKTQSEGGVFLPENYALSSRLGTVVATGKGRISTKTGTLIPCVAKPGDVVIFTIWGGQMISHNGKQYKMLKESNDIFAIITDTNKHDIELREE